MSNHLSPEEIELLAAHRLKGAKRVQLLVHLEDCAECRARLPKPSKKEFVDRLFSDDNGAASAKAFKKEK